MCALKIVEKTGKTVKKYGGKVLDSIFQGRHIKNIIKKLDPDSIKDMTLSEIMKHFDELVTSMYELLEWRTNVRGEILKEKKGESVKNFLRRIGAGTLHALRALNNLGSLLWSFMAHNVEGRGKDYALAVKKKTKGENEQNEIQSEKGKNDVDNDFKYSVTEKTSAKDIEHAIENMHKNWTFKSGIFNGFQLALKMPTYYQMIQVLSDARVFEHMEYSLLDSRWKGGYTAAKKMFDALTGLILDKNRITNKKDIEIALNAEITEINCEMTSSGNEYRFGEKQNSEEENPNVNDNQNNKDLNDNNVKNNEQNENNIRIPLNPNELTHRPQPSKLFGCDYKDFEQTNDHIPGTEGFVNTLRFWHIEFITLKQKAPNILHVNTEEPGTPYLELLEAQIDIEKYRKEHPPKTDDENKKLENAVNKLLVTFKPEELKQIASRIQPKNEN